MATVVKKPRKNLFCLSESDKLKAALFNYFRFKNSMHCTSEVICEYFTNNTVDIEDFIAFNETDIICVEVKVTKSDFLADFTKLKHKDFACRYTQFYFCVASEIQDFTLNYLKENYNSYGLLICEDDKIKVIKKAKVNKNLTFRRDKKYLFLRMSSELANLQVNNMIKESKMTAYSKIVQNILSHYFQYSSFLGYITEGNTKYLKYSTDNLDEAHVEMLKEELKDLPENSYKLESKENTWILSISGNLI